MKTRIYAAPAVKGLTPCDVLSHLLRYPYNLCLCKSIYNKGMFNPLTAGAAYIRDFIFISTLSTTFLIC